MKIDFNEKYTMSLTEIGLMLSATLILGAIFWILAPILIFLIGAGFIIYISFSLWDYIQKKTTKKIRIPVE